LPAQDLVVSAAVIVTCSAPMPNDACHQNVTYKSLSCQSPLLATLVDAHPPGIPSQTQPTTHNNVQEKQITCKSEKLASRFWIEKHLAPASRITAEVMPNWVSCQLWPLSASCCLLNKVLQQIS
jgi:hypothetical protein